MVRIYLFPREQHFSLCNLCDNSTLMKHELGRTGDPKRKKHIGETKTSLKKPRSREFAGLKELTKLTEYTTSELQQLVFNTGQKFAEYAHENQIGIIICPDRAARFLSKAVRSYWRQAYPQERMPDVYFINPAGLQTKKDVLKGVYDIWEKISKPKYGSLDDPSEKLTPENADTVSIGSLWEVFLSPTRWHENIPDLSPQEIAIAMYECSSLPFSLRLEKSSNTDGLLNQELENDLQKVLREKGKTKDEIQRLIDTEFLPHAALWFIDANVWAKKLQEARTGPEEIINDFHRSLPGLHKDTTKDVLILDACIHAGTAINTLQVALAEIGYDKRKIKIGLVTDQENRSDLVPNIVINNALPPYPHYPIGRDSTVTSSAGSVLSLPTKLSDNVTEEERDVMGELLQKNKKRRKEIGGIIKEIFSGQD